MLQYPFGRIAHTYVLEEFRGKRLSMILRKEMCDRIIEGGDLPESVIFKGNTIAAHLLKEAGYTEMFKEKALSIGLTK